MKNALQLFFEKAFLEKQLFALRIGDAAACKQLIASFADLAQTLEKQRKANRRNIHHVVAIKVRVKDEIGRIADARIQFEETLSSLVSSGSQQQGAKGLP